MHDVHPRTVNIPTGLDDERKCGKPGTDNARERFHDQAFEYRLLCGSTAPEKHFQYTVYRQRMKSAQLQTCHL